MNHIKRYSKTFITISIDLMLSFVLQIFSSSIPYFSYVLATSIILVNSLIFRKISRKALILTLVVIIILIGGIEFSNHFLNIENNNYLYAMVYPLFMYSFVNLCAFRKENSINKQELLLFYKICCVIGLVTAVGNYVINRNLFINITNFYDSYKYSFSSFYKNRNTFAVMMCGYSYTCVYLLLNEKRKLKYILLYLFFLANTIFSFSRAAILLQVVFAFLIALNHIIKSRKRIMWLLMIFAAVLIVLYLFTHYYDFIMHFIIRKEYGVNNRNIIWQRGLELLANSPIIGGGPCVCEELLRDLGYNSMHNTFLEILVYGGFVFAMVHIYLLSEVYKKIKTIKKQERLMHTIFCSFMLAFAIYSFFESTILFELDSKGVLFTIIIYVIPILYKVN